MSRVQTEFRKRTNADNGEESADIEEYFWSVTWKTGWEEVVSQVIEVHKKCFDEAQYVERVQAPWYLRCETP